MLRGIKNHGQTHPFVNSHPIVGPPSRIVGPKPLWQGLCVAAPGSLRNDLGPRQHVAAGKFPAAAHWIVDFDMS